jgi:hypothetical protein
MKKYSIPIIFLFASLLSVYLTDCKPEKKETTEPEEPIKTQTLVYRDSTGARAHLIELQVNTADLNNPGGGKKWKFTGQGSTEPDSLFTTDVGPGDIVIWVGVSSSSIADYVEITKIKHKSGVQILTKKTLTGRDGIIIGKVDDKPDSGAVGKYELDFRVTNKLLEASDTIPIDPKLRMHKE